MRTSRIKISPEEGAALYHCMTRTVAGEFLFADLEKEEIRLFVRVIADACGVEVLTFCIMSNHLHIFVLVPQSQPVSDEELLRRYQLRRPKPTKYDVRDIGAMRLHLSANDAEGVAWRKRQMLLMGDLSQYMKLLKQKITTYYNRRHNRFGTLWAERFKSVLVESESQLALIFAAYVDLNPTRANLVSDPKDYRFCGYAEAIAGNAVAQRGLMRVTGHPTWEQAHASYRLALFGIATETREKGRILPGEDLARVTCQQGRLPMAELLRTRLRFLSDTVALGTRNFVAAHAADYRRRAALRRERSPRPVRPLAPWGEFTAVRDVRMASQRS